MKMDNDDYDVVSSQTMEKRNQKAKQGLEIYYHYQGRRKEKVKQAVTLPKEEDEVIEIGIEVEDDDV